MVTVNDDGYSITVQANTIAGPRQVSTDVLDSQPYPQGSTTDLLLDPQDDSWSRLVAEPQDSTGWMSAGLAALLLALVLALRERHGRRALRRLYSGEHPALRVWILAGDSGAASIFTDDGTGEPVTDGGPVASLPVEWTYFPDDLDREDEDGWGADRDGSGQFGDGVGHPCDGPDDDPDDNTDDDPDGYAASFGRAWRGEQDPEDDEAFTIDPVVPEPAVLLGSLRDRGWAVLVTQDDVLVPTGPMRVRRRTPGGPSPLATSLRRLMRRLWHHPADDQDALSDDSDGFSLPGVPVSVGLQDPVDLPVVARPPDATRALGLAMLATALFGAPTALLLVGLDWYESTLVILAGGNLLLGGISRALQQVRLTHTDLEVTGSWRIFQVPWERLHGVRRSAATLSVAWEPDMITDVGPFNAPGGRDARAVRAEQLGAAMLRLREGALVPGTGGERMSSRPGPAWAIFAAYAALNALALWTS